MRSVFDPGGTIAALDPAGAAHFWSIDGSMTSDPVHYLTPGEIYAAAEEAMRGGPGRDDTGAESSSKYGVVRGAAGGRA